MGGLFSWPSLGGPTWFSYYGPIRRAEASEALDAAITSHLQEIGSASSIPIRRESAAEIVVPVGLDPVPFTEDESGLTIHFSTSAPCVLICSCDGDPAGRRYPEGLNLSYTFSKRPRGRFIMRFDFELTEGVRSRLFTFVMTVRSPWPVLFDDQIMIDGVTSSISPVYQSEEASNQSEFSDGTCLICCSEPASVIAYPCRHCCMCSRCSKRFASLSNHCPVCRGRVVELIDCGPFSSN
jgi:hypothetical protein